MSSIFAYIGSRPCKEILLKGTALLEKRGGECSGIAVKTEDAFVPLKVKGGAKELCAKASSLKGDTGIGIASTGKALRCAAAAASAPPAVNTLYAAVCDGTVENFDALKRWSREPFEIVTDEELLLACLCLSDEENKMQTLFKVKELLQGSVAFAFIPSGENALYCYAGGAPLFIGTGEDGVYLASECIALQPFCEKYTALPDGHSARLTADRITVYDEKRKKCKATLQPLPGDTYFENDYLLKDEVYYCPLTARETYGTLVKSEKLQFETLKLSRRQLEKYKQILLVGAGESYPAALSGQYLFEMLCDIPALAVCAGEWRYSHAVFEKNTLVICVSHRGEDGDILACVKRAKSVGAHTLAVTGNVLSSLARECRSTVNTCSDFEKGSVSLRNYISEYLTLALLALFIGGKRGMVTPLYQNVALKMGEMLFGKIATAVKNSLPLHQAAEQLLAAQSVFVAGMGADVALSHEAALKLSRIAGVNARPVCLSEAEHLGGELLEKALVLVFLTQQDASSKLLPRIRRLQAMGAQVLLFTTESIAQDIDAFPLVVASADSLPVFSPLPCIAGVYKMAVDAAEIKERIFRSQAS